MGSMRLEGMSYQDMRFTPSPPWFEVERPVSLDDETVFLSRFSGNHERIHVLLHDERGRLLGLGIGQDPQGENAKFLAQISEERFRANDEGIDSGLERVSWSLSSIIKHHRFSVSDKRINSVLSGLSSIVAFPREMSGWTLSWSPGFLGEDDSEPFVLGDGKWPQIERTVSDMMMRDFLFKSVQSNEIDRFMEQGRWRMPTKIFRGAGSGTLRILKM